MATEIKTVLKLKSGNACTSHILSRFGNGSKTACGLTVTNLRSRGDWTMFTVGWAEDSGRVDTETCGRCLKSEEAPCEIPYWLPGGEPTANHKMAFPKAFGEPGVLAVCIKCGLQSDLR